ncbi:MBL fold metallo-hydrolase [bacterium]|nr:MBL fold metallo-hydrolase [bacterium]
MALTIQMLGGPGRDNALFVRVETGQANTRLLFDCGDGCPHALDLTELRQVDHVLFSHFHMDHVAGFDAFFRATFDRTDRPNHVWGPPGTAAILHHRLRGFQWNLAAGTPVGWHAHDIGATAVTTTLFDLADAFASAAPGDEWPAADPLIVGDGFAVEARLLDHGTPSAAYLVREPPRVNVDPARLAAAGLAPGPWLKRVRGPAAAPGETVAVGGTDVSLAALQADLLVTAPGESVAYLTDFHLTAATRGPVAEWLKGVGALVCESQYRAADADLAERTRHMTGVAAAELAAAAGVGRLVLFHVSDRYDAAGWRDLLAEARAVFPATTFPDHWGLGE